MILKQIKNQLSKLEDVVKIFELENSKSVCRELILAKIRANKTEKQEVITIADIFRAKVVDVSKDNLMIELTGNVNKIEAFINLISDFGVIEIVRTGITGLSRGEDNSNIFLMRVTGQDPYYKAKKWRNEKWQRFIIKKTVTYHF